MKVKSSIFHDAELTGLHVSRIQKTVSLTFRLVGGQTKTITLINVAQFRATDFILQNVVSRLRISSQSRIPRDQAIFWIKFSSSLADTDTFMSDSQINQLVEKIDAGGMILFVLEPSFGAELVAVCESIDLENKFVDQT